MRTGLAAAAVALAVAGVAANPDAIRSLKVRGTLLEVGRAVGEAFGSSIRAKLDGAGYQSLWSFVTTTEKGKDAFARMWRAVNSSGRFAPFLDEVRGMADGANVTFERALMMQMGDELELLSGQHVDHCTDVVAPAATGEGSFAPVPAGAAVSGVLAHNEDGGRVNFGLTYLLDADVSADGQVPAHGFTAYCYPGQLPTGAFGFTRHGTVLTTNGLFPLRVDVDAVPRHFVSRLAMAQPSARHVIDLLTSTRLACGFSANVAQAGAPGTMWNVETATGGEFSVLEVSAAEPVERNWAFHMNEYLRLDTPQSPDASSSHRLARADAMPAPASVGRVLDILGDRADRSYPIYRDGAPPDEYATLATVTFEIFNGTSEAGGRAWLQLNDPKSCQPLVEWTLPRPRPGR